MSVVTNTSEVSILRRKLERERSARLEAERIAEVATRSALHDPLTGLANRVMLDSSLRTAISRARRSDHRLGILFLDIDRFKVINDSLGHEAGDAVLCEAAKRVEQAIRCVDTAARLGGDEFAVLCEDVGDIHSLVLVVERVLESFSKTVQVAGKEISIEPSIGVVLANGEETAGDLIRNADAAMYVAKGNGGGCFEIFDEAMRESAFEQMALESALRTALREGELRVAFQPLVELASGRVESVEALARWVDPDRGAVAPDVFIRIAEESRQIEELGRQILDRALENYVEWLRGLGMSAADDSAPGLSVNFSPDQLVRSRVAPRIAERLAAHSIPIERLTIEITESVLMQRNEAVSANLRALSELGIRLDIDDFGTGYSSLAYLKRFRVDRLKIDRMFIRDLETESESQAIVGAVTSMADALQIETVAEGVETRAQLELVRALGCTYAQGYLFGRPGPFETVAARYER